MTTDDPVSAADLVADADALLVCAGAGMGVDSGLPDFRGDHGFWRAYPPYERLGLRFVELADPAHFDADPELAWGFYGHRLALYRDTDPHPGFDILRRWAARMPHGAGVFTSNVDAQFQRAGFARIAEAHGSIHHLQCAQPCTNAVWPADDHVITVDTTTMRAQPPLPTCPTCGNVARPNILMFGDGAWLPQRSDDQLAELTEWLRGTSRPVVVELGAGRAVPTVRRYAEHVTTVSQRLVRINPREPDVPAGYGVSLATGALDALSAIDAALARR